MDIYKATFDYLHEILPVQEWPDINAVLERAKIRRPRDWQLPVLACESVGGKLEKTIPAVAAIGCMQISIILIDDMLDADPRGEHQRIGAPAVANLAIAFQAAGIEAISQSDIDSESKVAACLNLSRMMRTTAYGQFLDTLNPQDESGYWHLVQTKSSPFFGSALSVGAILGEAEPAIWMQIEKFGHVYGEMIQIHDDLNDTMAVPANPDWTLGRAPLPILFAQSENHPQKTRFRNLRRLMPSPDALTEAQEILIRCGAVSYCIHQLIQRYQDAIEILSKLTLASTKPLESLLSDVIIPVMNLFEEIGVGDPEALIFQSEARV